MNRVPQCHDDVCITCSDVAVEVTVVRLLGDELAVVETGLGEEEVSVALVTARKTLAADRYPEAVFAATTFTPAAGGGEISGTFTLHGETRPLQVHVDETGPDRYHAETTVIQSNYGIKPYTGFLGALRVRDAVDVVADVDLSQPADGTGG